MDTDLFRWTAVGGLAGLAILLLVAILVIARIGRRIAAAAEAVRDEIANRSLPSAQAGQVGTSPEGDEGRAEAPDQVRDAATADVAADASGVETAAAAEPSPGEAERAEREELVAAATADDGGGAAETSAAGAGTEQGAEEPQEQPFERDGRWWFRRGDELLVYDEGTGQWLQAPGSRAGTTGGGGTHGASASAATELAGGGVATRAEDEIGARAAEASSSFWKCPACGAVNGATATSCRMCFTARP